MLKYVREQLKKQGLFAESVVNNVDELDDDMFVEAAHVLDELGELSGSGTMDHTAIRNPISIPLEDDIEIDTVEFCMVDSRMSDIPGDAALQEAYYDDLKHFSDFYAEAYHATTRLPRESSDTFSDRVFDKQNQLYNEYMETIVQEGLFGFGEIKASDESVPWKIHLNFGKLRANGGEEYNATLPIAYEVKKDKLLKKQLDAVKFYDYAKIHGYDVMMEYAKTKNIKVPKDGNIWDVIEPKLAYVPREQNSLYKIVIQFKNHTSGEEFYFAISATMRSNEKKKNVKSKSPDMDIVDSKEGSFEMKSTSKPSANYVNQQTVTEAYVSTYMPSRWNNNNYFQEAIDFGGGGDPPAMAGAPTAQPAGGDVPPAPDGNNAPPAPAPETNNAQPTETNINIDLPPEEGQGDANATDTQDDNQPTDPPQAENPNANDVTDQIANGVNEGLDKQNAANDVDLSADVGEDPNFDMNATAEPDMSNITNGPDIDTDLDDMSGAGDNPDVDIDTEPSVDMDFDKITLNQLIEQAQEKAKDMTIDQLKEFLMNNTMPNGEEVGADAVEDGVQESFIYTKSNINENLDILLKTALGILNDQKLELKRLISKFKKNGKKLNKCLSKAVKMDVYNEQEKKQLNLLNRCLVDLMTMLKENSSTSNTQTAKRLVKAFTSQAKAVGDIIDAHKSGKPVQEGAITALFNIRENLERKANYVHINVTMPIKNKVDADKLTLAFIKSYFKSKKETVSTGSAAGGYDDGFGYGTTSSHSTEYETDNARTNRLRMLKDLGVKIETKDRKRAKFSETELRNLDRTIHLSNELYDDITSALKVQREDEADKLLNAIGKEAVELDALCQTFKKQRSDK